MNRRGFTILELLIVISILGILATTAVLLLKPVEYLRQGRDTKRIADIGVLNVGLAEAYSSGVSLGAASTTVYVSLVDTVATCANLGLPPLPAGYQYHCVTSATDLKKVDGNGWVPVSFATLQGGSSITLLPTDPINNNTYFYTYVAGGRFAVSATLESDRYLKQNALKDGGTNPAKVEVGSDLGLLAKAEGLVGYWPLDEGGGIVANDASGNGNGGSFGGAPTWIVGKNGTALYFDGVDDSLGILDTPALRLNGDFSIAFWAKMDSFVHTYPGIIQKGNSAIADGYIIFYESNGTMYFKRNNAYVATPSGALTSGWKHFVLRYSGSSWAWYVNGASIASGAYAFPTNNGTTNLMLGTADEYGNESVDDMRFYNRALSAAEIQAMYNATK